MADFEEMEVEEQETEVAEETLPEASNESCDSDDGSGAIVGALLAAGAVVTIVAWEKVLKPVGKKVGRWAKKTIAEIQDKKDKKAEKAEAELKDSKIETTAEEVKEEPKE